MLFKINKNSIENNFTCVKNNIKFHMKKIIIFTFLYLYSLNSSAHLYEPQLKFKTNIQEHNIEPENISKQIRIRIEIAFIILTCSLH